MIFALSLLAFTAASPFFLWVYYLAVMNLKRNKGNLKGVSKVGGVMALTIGYLLDAYVNLTVMTLVLLEVPKELTVTSRLKRHYRLGEGSWGYKVATWFIPLLNPYDPGHISNG